VKAISDKTHMNGGRESHSGIVPAKRSNESQGGPKEIVEGRPLTGENVSPPTPALDSEPNEWANKWSIDVPAEHAALWPDPR
jgi:hypothetical protein